MSDVIGQAAFWTDKNLKRITNGLEEMMTGMEGGDVKKAMERLRRVFNLMLPFDLLSEARSIENLRKSTANEGTY